VLFVAPRDDFIIPFSYRLQWDIDYTNNVCKYEALVLGLEAAKKLKIENLVVYGDGIDCETDKETVPGQTPKVEVLHKLCLGSD
jgi:hypothetical protein